MIHRMLTARAVPRALCLAAGLALFAAAPAALSSAAHAQTAQPQTAQPQTAQAIPSEKYGDWAVACREVGSENPQERCVLTQNIVIRESSKRVLNISVTRPADDRPYIVAVTAPLGILLQAGLVLLVDDKEMVRFPLQICNVNGCHGQFPLSDEIRATLEGGQTGKISIRQPNGQPLAIQFSLTGFTAGMAALVAK